MSFCVRTGSGACAGAVCTDMSLICERHRLYLAQDRYNLLRVVPLLGSCPGLGLISCVAVFGFLGVEPTPVVEHALKKAACFEREC